MTNNQPKGRTSHIKWNEVKARAVPSGILAVIGALLFAYFEGTPQAPLVSISCWAFMLFVIFFVFLPDIPHRDKAITRYQSMDDDDAVEEINFVFDDAKTLKENVEVLRRRSE